MYMVRTNSQRKLYQSLLDYWNEVDRVAYMGLEGVRGASFMSAML